MNSYVEMIMVNKEQRQDNCFSILLILPAYVSPLLNYVGW